MVHTEQLAIINIYWSKVELETRLLLVVPGQVSSSRQRDILPCFMLVFSELLPYNGGFLNSKVMGFLENYLTRLL